MNTSKFTRRLLFYAIGVGIGFLAVYLFFGKRALPAVWPEGRVLEQIQHAKPADSTTWCYLRHFGMDTASFRNWMGTADVNFTDSSPREKPCPVYAIEGKILMKNSRVLIQSCDSLYSIRGLQVLENGAGTQSVACP
ncbi:MAG: hypothetical protein IBJ09_06515 [Bacteroidia bacterium]|nr:hypothetical protein [Bacteroidia bacterium]